MDSVLVILSKNNHLSKLQSFLYLERQFSGLVTIYGDEIFKGRPHPRPQIFFVKDEADLSPRLYGSLLGSVMINRPGPGPLPPLVFTPHSLKERLDMSNDRAANGQQQRKKGEDTLKGLVLACIIN